MATTSNPGTTDKASKAGVTFEPEVRPPADFILVQKTEISDALVFQTNQFLKNLKKAGLIIEVVPGIKYTDCIFIKLTATDESLNHLATVHGLFPTYHRDRSIPSYSKWFSFFKSKLSLKPKLQDPMFRRCSNSVRGDINTTFTSAERITLISCVLERTKYGRLTDEYGLGNLLANKNFDDAYPLHDGPLKWSESGPLNDRQVLAEYWASWYKFYQLQPIHIIYKYYGSEIAFFYAWLQFYTILVLIPAFLGLFAICMSYCDLNHPLLHPVRRVNEICESNKTICPTCTDKHCGYTTLSDYCSVAKTVYYLDNNYTVVLALFMTLWASLFVKLWNRAECIWQYKWNLNSCVPQIDEMANYKVRVRAYTKYNKYTQTEEHYTPFKMRFPRIVESLITVTAFVLLLGITTALILLSEHLIMYYLLKYQVTAAVDHLLFIMRVYNCFCTIILIKTYSPLINRVCKYLTDREIHRTQNNYLTAYIFKSYVLNFFNSYLMSFYNSFIKESMFTNPGDYVIYNRLYGIGAALCPPGMGCYLGLFMSISFNIMKEYILLFFLNGYLMSSLIEGFKNLHRRILEQLTLRRGIVKVDIPQWEEEYALKPISSTYFCDAFVDLVIEYGLFVFYSAAVPILPLLVLMNNIAEIRITSRTLLLKSRRNIPKRVTSLGAWKTIFIIVTRLCYLISAGVVCFTSTLVHRSVYYFNNGESMKGFINDTLTAFLVEDFSGEVKENLVKQFPNVSVCYFNGAKNDFDDVTPYQKGDKFYHLLAMKFVAAVLYIHGVYFLNSIVTFFIPNVPSVVTESEAYDDMLARTKEMERITSGKR
ncbi:anoctamin-4-like [Onthophagus taurus]|uniref:anoctamin-4-like n=1 Tax=Onthophagus taurus TaxID=166361 RepID=UPI0039BE9B0A